MARSRKDRICRKGVARIVLADVFLDSTADGEAAALALEKKVELSEVPVEELRERLRENGNLF